MPSGAVPGSPVPRERASWALLLVILGLAAALRFTGLGWGLRHEPHIDERVFVEAVEQMLVERDLDHRFYQYPGLMFYLLAPVLALFDPPPFGATAYLAARGLIAAFGVLGVFLGYRLGRTLGGERAGLFAALVLAVSPADVHSAHMLRPDVALQVLATATLLACCRLGARVGDDVRAGAWLGAALALKFSAVFLVPAYLAARALRPGPRVKGVLAAGVTAAVAFALLSPYALLHLFDFVGGVREQVVHHYQGDQTSTSTLGFYLGHLARTLGPLAAALAAVGAWQRRRDPLTAAVLVQVGATVAVLSTADTRFMRHLVPSLGGLAALAGVGFVAVSERFQRLALPLALAATLLPLSHAVAYVRDVARPSTWDRSADWIAAHVPEGSRVLTSQPLGLESGRHEALRATGDARLDRLLALEVELVVWDEGSAPSVVAGFETRQVVDPLGAANGRRMTLLAAPAALRPRYERLKLGVDALSSSEPGLALEPLVDGAPASFVLFPPQPTTRWVQVELGAAHRVARVELGLGAKARTARSGVELQVRRPEGGWRKVEVVDARPHPALQARARGLSRLMLLEPTETTALRLVYDGRKGWPLAEVLVDVVSE
ncbi:MAG: glycosyltransferase family 39 protein [Vicinamibacteria bacterium]|nr:glycosyltransferase family 39 protein [Vicinamibacteria bacterium]